MALHPGTRLGPFEVAEQIGSGGMGEVYRARDTKLNRDVALKLLPAALTSDPDRVARFKREAQALASLNHPNIVTIYSIEEADTHVVLTMELVSGRSLADVLPRNGFALGELLRIALPLVDAIAAAHQKGITHRDLKPANIMLGAGEHDGRVKVLDFGLARLAKATLEPAGPTVSSTMTLTGDGRILGTVAYMSPEQAEGKPLDARSDLFSLGVILYEMATGHRPFTGDTNLSIVSAIIKDTPPPVTELNPALPRDLAGIIRRALVKNPGQRYQTAIDLRSDLGDLNELPPGSTSAARWRVRAAAIGAATAALVLAVAVYLLVASRPSSELSLQNLQVTQLTTSGNAKFPGVSPDGKFVAYVRHDNSSESSLWVRQVAGTGDLPLVPPEAGVVLEGVTVTPDGNSVDYLRNKPGEGSALWRVPLLGGTPKRIIESVQSGIGWSPDGKSMAFVRREWRGSDSLIVADAEGRGERVLASRQWPRMYTTTALNVGTIGRPSWSVDGRLIALTGEIPGTSRPQVVVVNAATGREEQVMPLLPGNAHLVEWLDSSSLILDAALNGTTSQFWKLSYPAGKLERLTNDLSNYEAISLTADRDALATARRDAGAGIWVAPASGTNAKEVIPSSPFVLGVSWAGDRLVFLNVSTGVPSVAIGAPNARSGETIVVQGLYPTGTSDGRTIVYVKADPETRGLWKVDVEGRQPMRLTDELGVWPVVTPDDRWVVFLSLRSGVQSPWIVSIDGGEPSQIVNQHAVPGFSVSRDGRTLLFRRAEAGTLGGTTAAICDLPRCGDPKTVTIPHHFTGIQWTPDGRGIAYLDATSTNIWVQPLDGGSPRQLTDFKDGRLTISGFAWSPDGNRLAINRVSGSTDIVLFKGLKR